MSQELNDDTAFKLMEEKEKFNTLKSDRIDTNERMFLKNKQITEDTAYNKETEIMIAKLKIEIEKLEKDVTLKGGLHESETKLNLDATRINRNLCQK